MAKSQRIASLSKNAVLLLFYALSRSCASRGAREPAVCSQWSKLFHASTVTNPLGVDRCSRSVEDRRKGRVDDLAHVPLLDYINVRRVRRTRRAGLQKAGQRGGVWRPTNVKCKDLLNVSWVWGLPPSSARSFNLRMTRCQWATC